MNLLYMTVKVHEIREIRPGKFSKAFRQWSETKRLDPELCFIILHGSDFNLLSECIIGKNARVCLSYETPEILDQTNNTTVTAPRVVTASQWKEYLNAILAQEIPYSIKIDNWICTLYEILRRGNET